MSNTLTSVAATVIETRAQFAHSDLRGAADRSDRTGGEHRRRGVVRHVVGQPDGAAEHDVPGRQQPVASGRRARASGPASTSSTTTTASPIRVRCAALRVLVAGELSGRHVYNNAGFTQTFGVTEVSQTNPNLGVLRAGRVEGDVPR